MPGGTATIYRWRLVWSGFIGGPGLTTFYTSTDSSVVSSANGFFRTFFEAMKPNFPNGTTITYPSSCDSIDPVTGFIGTTIGVSAPAVTTSTSAATQYAGGVGLQIRWHTDAYTASIKPPYGHTRVVGWTSLVPLNNAVYGTDGQLSPSFATAVQGNANTLQSSFAGNLKIWSRPIVDTAGTTLRAGCTGSILSASVKPLVTQLASRRS